MGNLVSLMAHVPRGGEIIAGEGSHSFAHEAANFAVVVGASMKLLPWDDDGRMDLDAIDRAFRDPNDVHEPITSLVMLENTHADSMAQPLPAEYIERGRRASRTRAACRSTSTGRASSTPSVALGTPVRELLAPRPTRRPSACRRASPARSDRSSSAATDFIWRARRARKLLGGGMRQAGVLAAAGLIALRDGPAGMIDRLAEDHVNARRLADGLADLPGIVDLDPARVRTNFVFFELAPARAAHAVPRRRSSARAC